MNYQNRLLARISPTIALVATLAIYNQWVPAQPAFAQAEPSNQDIETDNHRHSVTQLEVELPQLDANPNNRTSSETVLPTLALEQTYSLGPGDQIRIEVFEAPEYSGDALVLPDGTITLPTTGRISVQGLSLLQAADAISQQYAPFIHHPQVTVSPTALRPVNIGIVGAVNRPGTYTIPIETEGLNHFPTLTDAIRLAGGISSQADIRQVEIYRPQQASEAQTITINLWDLLKNGNMSGDVLIQSGDTVSIPIAETIDPEEAAQIGAASFSPETVTVYVVGEVSNPGPVNVSPNTPLNQAILAAGGFNSQRADNDQIGLVRLNVDGTVEKRDVEVDFTSGIDEETNPILLANDVVVVERSGIASFSDSASLALNPIGGFISSLFSIFKLF